jgi:hypothetical protein
MGANAFCLEDQEPYELGEIASTIIHTLAYFSVFRHPLREDEMLRFMQFRRVSVEELRATLHYLVERRLVSKRGGVYCLAGQEEIVELRRERNQRAKEWMQKLGGAVRVMNSLPFTDGLALTGSLSKGTQDANGDIDFMVLVRPGRVWTHHLFFTVLYRIRRKWAQKHLCGNLRIASDRLCIRTKNLFTATEIATLLPLTNQRLWHRFYDENSWVSYFYPAWRPADRDTPSPGNTPIFRSAIERVLGGKFGDWIEQALFHVLSRRLRRKEAAQGDSGPLRRRWLELSEIGHPALRQDHWRTAWQARLDGFEERHTARVTRWPWDLVPVPAASRHDFGRAITNMVSASDVRPAGANSAATERRLTLASKPGRGKRERMDSAMSQ